MLFISLLNVFCISCYTLVSVYIFLFYEMLVLKGIPISIYYKKYNICNVT